MASPGRSLGVVVGGADPGPVNINGPHGPLLAVPFFIHYHPSNTVHTKDLHYLPYCSVTHTLLQHLLQQHIRIHNTSKPGAHRDIFLLPATRTNHTDNPFHSKSQSKALKVLFIFSIIALTTINSGPWHPEEVMGKEYPRTCESYLKYYKCGCSMEKIDSCRKHKDTVRAFL